MLTITEHDINPKNISENAVFVCEKLLEHKYQAYLVGGGVRDLLLDEKPKDFDVATDAPPEELKKVFKNCRIIGKRFRLGHV